MTHVSSDSSGGRACFIVCVDRKFAGPARTIPRCVASWSCHRESTNEQAGHKSPKNRSGPHHEIETTVGNMREIYV